VSARSPGNLQDAEPFDAIIVGSGEAGKWMTWHLGPSGKRVAVVERSLMGGACPNVACASGSGWASCCPRSSWP
jgi:ribulose 1,5-bisphosphate synthetase/thiazole synthase